METRLEKPNDQTNTPQQNYVSPMGPGQIVYTNFRETQNNTGSENLENRKEGANEMKTKEPKEEDSRDMTMSANDLETNTGLKCETFQERESAGKKMKTMKDSQTETGPETVPSQQSIQISSKDTDAIFNPLEDGLEDEKNLAISPRQAKGLASMLMSHSIIEASRTSGIPERTLRRWITDPKFKLAFREEIERIKQAYLLETLSLLGPSIQARRDLLENPTQPGAAIKEKVADKTIKSCEKSLEMLSTEERIERLERMVRKHV